MIEDVSEIEIAKIFDQELKFYREIESLRKNLIQDYGYNVWEFWRVVDP